MGENVSLLRTVDQSPVIRLLFSLLFTVITGTIFFWVLIYCGSLIFDTPISVMTATSIPGEIEKKLWIVRYVQVSQQIGLFLIPSIFLAALFRINDKSFLMLDRPLSLYSTTLIIILIIIIIPVISWTGAVNSELSLPAWLSGVEDMIREKEAKASGILAILMRSGGIGTMTLNLLILAIIPSFAEELLFRGIFQQLFIRFFRSNHAGVWITAVLFSAAHFQFYGFLPRMILGLLFGYLFLWTANIWSAIIPHFLNNAIPVVLTFISERKEVTGQVNGEGSVFPFIQIVLSALILYYIWFFRRVKPRLPDKN